MKDRKPISISRVVLIYAVTLLISFSLANFIPIDALEKTAFIDHLQDRDVVFRQIGFILSTVVFLILVPVMLSRNFHGFDRRRFQSIHWGNFLVIAVVAPLLWLGYPALALCKTCWTSNDFFYAVATIGVFVAMQLSMHGILLKITRN